MTVIFVITKNKYFNVIEETAQTIMCMDFINDIVWCIIDCLYQIVPDMFLCIFISMIDSGNKYPTCFSSVDDEFQNCVCKRRHDRKSKGVAHDDKDKPTCMPFIL